MTSHCGPDDESQRSSPTTAGSRRGVAGTRPGPGWFFSYETRWSGARYTAALGTKSHRIVDGNVTEMLRTRLQARGAAPGFQRELPAAGQAIGVSPRRFQKLMHYSNFCDNPCIAPSPPVDCRNTFYPGHRQRSLRIITPSLLKRVRQGGCASLVNSYHALLALRAQARLLTSNNCQRRDCMRSSKRIRFPFGVPITTGRRPFGHIRRKNVRGFCMTPRVGFHGT